MSPRSRIGALAAGVALLATRGALGAPCGAFACLQAAAGARGDCAAQAKDDFTAAKGLCEERDPICVMACVGRREECRTGIGLGLGLAACDDQLRQARAECVARHRRGSVRRALCLDRADLANVRCRARVRRETRRERRRCDQEVVVCIDACGPGSPPGGSVACRAEAAQALEAAVADCGATARATRDACLDRDQACVEDCRDARDGCEAPTQSTLASALVACDAEERAAVAACAGDASCVQAAEANGLACREAARTAAAPGLVACAEAYRQCSRSCPPPAIEPTASGGEVVLRGQSACMLGRLGVLR